MIQFVLPPLRLLTACSPIIQPPPPSPSSSSPRPWELKPTESIDVSDAMGANIKIDSRGVEVRYHAGCLARAGLLADRLTNLHVSALSTSRGLGHVFVRCTCHSATPLLLQSSAGQVRGTSLERGCELVEDQLLNHLAHP